MNAAKRPVTSSDQFSSSGFSYPPQPQTVPLQAKRSHPRQDDGVPANTANNVNQAKGYRPKRAAHTGARQAIALESSVKLTVNLLLAIVATTTIAKLVPYYQSQQQRLTTLQESVAVAERKNDKLRSQFNENFDPAQASRIMQEQSGMGYPNQKRIIWESPIEQP